MKRPSFQFYPADWRTDAALQSCSISARGLWLELICFMNDCIPYGHLCIAGKSVAAEQVARLVGATLKEYNRLLKELKDAGVPRFTAEGIMYSKRMVDDEAERESWRERQGKSRARHADVTQQVTPPVTPESRPPSSSSSSSSSSPSPVKEKEVSISAVPALKRRSKNLLNGHGRDFDEFYEAFPKHVAKGAAAKAYNSALARASPECILAGAKAYADHRLNEHPQYTKNPATWLNADCWTDEIPPKDQNHDQAKGFDAALQGGALFLQDLADERARVSSGDGTLVDLAPAGGSGADGPKSLAGPVSCPLGGHAAPGPFGAAGRDRPLPPKPGE